MSLFYLPQFKQVNLVAPAGITAVQTAGIKLSNVDGIDKTKPGIICLTWALAIDTAVAEWASYTSIDANDELVGVIRGAEGFSAKEHLSNAVIAWSYSKSHINNLNDAFLTEHNENGTHKAMTSPIFITPKIKDTSSDHDYIFAVSELTANRTITLPLLTGNDEFVFKDFIQELANKTFLSPLFKGNIDGWISTGTFNYASADAPTFTITVASGAALIYGVGDRIKLTQTTVKYFIITAVADTSLTVYGGTDYTLTGGAITLPYYSHQKAPLGFPLNKTKWTAQTISTNDIGQVPPTQNVWYNIGSVSLSVPIGSWELGYSCVCNPYDVGGATTDQETTLSTANNSSSDNDFKCRTTTVINGGDFMHSKSKIVNLATKTVYYLNDRTIVTTVDGIRHLASTYGINTIIRAICAYL